ncbi:helix-turn-helix protein [Alteromonadaceae bacterium 2753L.S.0a.02]|nr:helix-turn-helix protein [Alteromonadaceae bacterium 2753L.S.0a.02]
MSSGTKRINDDDARIATQKEINAINERETAFKEGVGHALAWIYRQQCWSPEKIARRIKGLKPGTWRAYAQASYPNNRSLHVIAAFSWLSQVSMLALLKGTLIQTHWDTMDEHSLCALLHSSLLSKKQFYALMMFLANDLEELGVKLTALFWDRLAEVSNYPDDFMAPRELDLEEFRADYYESTGFVLRALREKSGYSIEQMAEVIGVSEERYLGYENPDRSTNIPVQAAYRLKLGFHLKDTTGFLVKMHRFPGFFKARKVQQLRDELIFELFSHVPPNHKGRFVVLARNIMEFRQNQAR